MNNRSSEPIEVFFSYSHKDEELRDALAVHLKLLQRQGVITAWHDREITAGTEWAGEIDEKINSARIILLLVSADFLASDYCYDIELQQAMARHEAGGAQVIPIILRPVDWEGVPFGKLQALPKNAKPVTTWDNRDEAFRDIAQGLRKAVEGLPPAPRLFISYKRDVAPDESVARQLAQVLGQRYAVAIDQNMRVGTDWMAWIEQQLRQSDFLVVLLSEASVGSEMVLLEIEKACHWQQQQGYPKILPVRLAYRESFGYPLNEYLNALNWAFWRDEQDTPQLIAELQRAIAGDDLSVNTAGLKAEIVQVRADLALPPPQPVAQPRSLELPEGTMDLESQFYIEREDDRLALETMQRQGVTITIKGPRQMGKSSLLNRVMQTARQAGKEVVFLDFQLFAKHLLKSGDGDAFFREFCICLTEELDLEDKVEEYWQRPISNGQRCTRYVGRHLLKVLNRPLVLAMDEVESIFEASFRTDFFSMLRSWHNSRATTPLWKQLDLALVTSTEPYQLIDDLNQSPFNVGQVVELSDFTAAQVHDLNQKHGLPFNAEQEQRLMQLVNGHPYLVRRALYLVASGQITVKDLFAQATAERGPFGDHLRYHLFRMYDKAELVQGLLQVMRRPMALDEAIFFRLRGAGLVRRQGQQVIPRCQLYAAYFQEHLHD